MKSRKMKTLFVPLSHNMHLSYHHGIGMLSAVARHYGAEVAVYQIHSDLGHPPIAEKCAREISLFCPDFIGISTSSLEWEFAKILASEIRKISHAKLIVGGPHPTFCKITNSELDLFDHVIIGEGEKIVEKLSLGEPLGDKVICGSMISDLDTLPFSDRGLFDMDRIITARQGIVDFITQRGCPYNCSFCSNHALRELYGVKFLRHRSVNNVVEEIKDVIRKYSCRMIFFHDDIFTLQRRWVKEFCNRYKEEIMLPWTINSHVDHVGDEVLECLAQAGCLEIKIGVESGDEEVRRDVLGKKITNRKIKERFAAIRAKGMRTFAFIMHGVPGETENTFLKSVELMAEIQPNTIRSTIFFPLPNTVLGDPFYGGDEKLLSSMLGDTPTSSLDHSMATLRRFYMFGWKINLKLGLEEYKTLIERYSTKTDIHVEGLKSDDLKLSINMMLQGKIHYRFGGECSMLKLEDGEEFLLS